jgi:hypothetical protein
MGYYDKKKIRSRLEAAVGRARNFAAAHTGGYVVVRDLDPIRHVEVAALGQDWAFIDAYCIAPSSYAGPIDSAEDIAATPVKPVGELLPMAIDAWLPRYEKLIARRLAALVPA